MRRPQVLLAATAAARSQWSTPVVVVPAHYREWGRTPPWATKLPPWASLYIYQRTKKGAPRYSPNYGYEAGVHLQFISEHYDDLPELVVFTQAKAETRLTDPAVRRVSRKKQQRFKDEFIEREIFIFG